MTGRITARLGAYLALLALTFGVAWLVGQWVGPLDSEMGSRPSHAGSGHTLERES